MIAGVLLFVSKKIDYKDNRVAGMMFLRNKRYIHRYNKQHPWDIMKNIQYIYTIRKGNIPQYMPYKNILIYIDIPQHIQHIKI